MAHADCSLCARQSKSGPSGEYPAIRLTARDTILLVAAGDMTHMSTRVRRFMPDSADAPAADRRRERQGPGELQGRRSDDHVAQGRADQVEGNQDRRLLGCTRRRGGANGYVAPLRRARLLLWQTASRSLRRRVSSVPGAGRRTRCGRSSSSYSPPARSTTIRALSAGPRLAARPTPTAASSISWRQRLGNPCRLAQAPRPHGHRASRSGPDEPGRCLGAEQHSSWSP
jgi:hypothetical protein